MPLDFPWLSALLAGLIINVADIGCTLLFAAQAWTVELRRQGLAPSKLTPPYYVLANFAGGLALCYTYLRFAQATAPGIDTALAAALLLWLISRLYGGGHVVMGQMPSRIFATMSAGLGLGYVLAGQALRLLLGP